MVLFPERYVFLLSLPGSVFFSARQEGYRKKQRKPHSLRMTGKGETQNDKKRNGAERSRGRKCLGKGDRFRKERKIASVQGKWLGQLSREWREKLSP